MIILWSLLLTAAASAHKVVESTEDIGPEAFGNITALYPIANQNTHNNTHENHETKNSPENVGNNTAMKEEKPKLPATSWKIEATYAESNFVKDNATSIAPEVELKNETKEFKPSQHLGSFMDYDVVPTRETFNSFTPVIKKPASGFVSSNEENHSNYKVPKELLYTHKEYPYKFESSIFTRAKDSWTPDRYKPWPQGTPSLEGLGDQHGKGWSLGGSAINGLEIPGKINHITSGFGGFGKRPETVWGGNSGFNGIRERPKGWGLDSLNPKPTVETPVMVPAGGLYKYPDPFKEEVPGKVQGAYDGDYALEFNSDVKESGIKKRENPWEGILRMLTAFIPVGIIISALTPSIITIENTTPGGTYPKIYRRTGSEAHELPAISERCRRRLLCELHNEKNYSTAPNSASSSRKWKQCYRIRCEDTSALAKTLGWLLERQMRKHN